MSPPHHFVTSHMD